MSVSQRFLCGFSNTFHSRSRYSSGIFLAFRHFYPTRSCSPLFPDIMPRKQSRGVGKEQRWVEKSKGNESVASSSASGSSSNAAMEAVADRYKTLTVAGEPIQSVPSVQFGSVGLTNSAPGCIWKPKSYGTVSGASGAGIDSAPVDQTTNLGNGTQRESTGTSAAVLSKLLSGKLLESFMTDSSTYSLAQVRATFYPKFENEKSDQEV